MRKIVGDGRCGGFYLWRARSTSVILLLSACMRNKRGLVSSGVVGLQGAEMLKKPKW